MSFSISDILFLVGYPLLFCAVPFVIATIVPNFYWLAVYALVGVGVAFVWFDTSANDGSAGQVIGAALIMMLRFAFVVGLLAKGADLVLRRREHRRFKWAPLSIGAVVAHTPYLLAVGSIAATAGS